MSEEKVAEKSDEEKYNEALKAVFDKEFKSAEKLLNACLKLKDKLLRRKVSLLLFDEKNTQNKKDINTTEILWLKSEADKGNSYAQNTVGKLIFNGQGIKKDYGVALHYYRLSANQGNPHGQFNVGFMYHFGISVHKSYQEAVRWYKRSVEQGNSNAQLNLGYMYHNGLGVEIDFEEAMRLYSLAADQGNSCGLCNKGYMFEHGLGGVEKNYVKAFKLYEKAARVEDRVGLNNLGHMFHHGYGVKKNLEQAMLLYSMSAKKGYYKARVNMKNLAKIL